MSTPELIPKPVPLSAIPGMTTRQTRFLEGIWVDTAQEFVSLVGTDEGTRALLAQAVNSTVEDLDQLAAAAHAVIPAESEPRSGAVAAMAATAHYGLGCLLDEPEEVLLERQRLPAYAPRPSRGVLPQSISLLDQLPPLRNQGTRGTCVAHAVLAMREQLEIASGCRRELDLSEQFVYWWCKQRDGIPTVAGTYLELGMACLNEVGAPLEELWPYFETELAGSQGQGPPPERASGGDLAFRTARTQQFNRSDIGGMKACLGEGRTIAVSFPVYNSWFSSIATRRWGKILMPLPGELPSGGHAITLVGYQDDATAPGGGFFLIRNSWQPWAYDSTIASGCGYMCYAYVGKYATAVFSAERLSGSEITIRESIDDIGTRPVQAPGWNSPDIWLRQQPDGCLSPQTPQPGQRNAIYVRVRNRGLAYAYNTKADIFVAPIGARIPHDGWELACQVDAPWIAPGLHILDAGPWTPPSADDYSFLVRITEADQQSPDLTEAMTSTRMAQRNLLVRTVPPGAVAEIGFTISGSGSVENAVHFQVEYGTLPAKSKLTPIKVQDDPESARWTARTIPEGTAAGVNEAEVGAGRFRRRAQLAVTVPDDAPAGATYLFRVNQMQGRAVVGRLTVQLFVDPAASAPS